MNPRWYILVGLLAVALVGCSRTATSTPVLPATPPETAEAGTRVAPAETPGSTPSFGLATKESPTKSPTKSPGGGKPTPKLVPAAKAFPEPPERDLYRLAAELSAVKKGIGRVVNRDPVSYVEGREDTFWLVDMPGLEVYSSRFELRLVTPHAYWYFEKGLPVHRADLELSAAQFEEEIYPRVTAAFGREWSPGVDNDPHLNILNARLSGVGGYYSSSDEYPLSVYRFSNQREVIYINTGAIPVGSLGYQEVLAHELQHAVHWNTDPSEDTWVNEGLSELAATVAGFDQASIYRYLLSRPTSLVHWPLSPAGSGASYGAASLFMHYLMEHYVDGNDLRPLLKEPADGIAGITAYLKASGYDATFREVFRDWAVANLLDEGQGPYGYSGLDVRAEVRSSIKRFSELESQIPQYSVEYVELGPFKEPLRLSFHAPTENDLLPAEVDSRGCWWGNSGDSINSTLTRGVDLTGVDRATLKYQVWYNLEKNWDYAYVEVSVDGGSTWDILGTPNTTRENPVGNSFGMGYTGESPGWIDESVDLTAYSGRPIQIRFQYVTDDAIHGAGLCIREVSIAEAGMSDWRQGWQAEGFVLTDNRVKQDYIVQVIQVGKESRVTVMPLDGANSGEVIVPAPQTLDRLVVAVAALAPKTRQEATYTLTVEPAG